MALDALELAKRSVDHDHLLTRHPAGAPAVLPGGWRSEL
jgi:hypothetical protein